MSQATVPAPRRLGLVVSAALLVGAAVGSGVYVSTPLRVPTPAASGSVPAALSPRRPALATSPATQPLAATIDWSVSFPSTATVRSPSAQREPTGAPALGTPVTVAIPALFLHAPVGPVEVSGGALEVPTNIRHVGWWASGGVPGAPRGTVVLDGHVDSAVHGLGAMWSLRFARPGELIHVGLSQGSTLQYRIVAVRAYPKASLPPTLFTGPVGAPRLALITCGGTFDRATGHYQSNVVVWAVPAA